MLDGLLSSFLRKSNHFLLLLVKTNIIKLIVSLNLKMLKTYFIFPKVWSCHVKPFVILFLWEFPENTFHVNLPHVVQWPENFQRQMSAVLAFKFGRGFTGYFFLQKIGDRDASFSDNIKENYLVSTFSFLPIVLTLEKRLILFPSILCCERKHLSWNILFWMGTKLIS